MSPKKDEARTAPFVWYSCTFSKIIYCVIFIFLDGFILITMARVKQQTARKSGANWADASKNNALKTKRGKGKGKGKTMKSTKEKQVKKRTYRYRPGTFAMKAIRRIQKVTS